MEWLTTKLLRLTADERAATAIEYCLIAGVISIAILVGARMIGLDLNSLFLGPLAAAMPN